jgi:hypothetical protein
MRISPAMQRFAAWIACCAVLLAALAPAISHALASHDVAQAWMEICTTEGEKTIQVAAEQSPESSTPKQHNDHFEHCPFCNTNNVATGLPPGVDIVLATIEHYRVFPALFYQAPQGLFVWTPASSRAPPVVS